MTNIACTQHSQASAAAVVDEDDVASRIENEHLRGRVRAAAGRIDLALDHSIEYFVNVMFMRLEDVDIKLHPAIGPVGGFGSYEGEGAAFAFVDGLVRSINDSVPQQTLDAPKTRDGNDRVDDF